MVISRVSSLDRVHDSRADILSVTVSSGNILTVSFEADLFAGRTILVLPREELLLATGSLLTDLVELLAMYVYSDTRLMSRSRLLHPRVPRTPGTMPC